jgi:hypothetical protein
VFTKQSRYVSVPDALFEDQTGRKIPYKLLRILSDSPGLQVHAVTQMDRLDLLAHRYFRDPEQFWRICDANRAMWPEDLVARIGRRLRIPITLR